MPSPRQLASSGSEHGEQAALFCFLHVAANYGFKAACDGRSFTEKGFAQAVDGSVAIPELAWVFAIPNGGSRGNDKRSAMIVGAQMKAEGVKSGVSDLMLPIPKHGLCGLFIEMKRADGGTPSANQKAFGDFVKSQGYGFCVCYGWIEAAEVIMRWMGYSFPPHWQKWA